MVRRLYASLPETQRQLLAFCTIGGVSFLVDNGILSFLTRVAGIDPAIGRIFSISIATVGSWLMNRSLTFRGARGIQPLWVEFLRFCAANGFGNLMNYLAFVLLVHHVGLFARIPELATIIGTAVGLVFNFTGSKYLVFRRS